MAGIPNKIRKIINTYLTSLHENGIQIKEAILFGSYAKGRSNQASDIDLALVSDQFEGIRFKDRNKIRRITISISSDLEVLPFNPKDFTPEDPLVKEILDTGIRLQVSPMS
jgi:predicted nucleotidyltransferase